jgi:hypothetical protein
VTWLRQARQMYLGLYAARKPSISTGMGEEHAPPALASSTAAATTADTPRPAQTRTSSGYRSSAWQIKARPVRCVVAGGGSQIVLPDVASCVNGSRELIPRARGNAAKTATLVSQRYCEKPRLSWRRAGNDGPPPLPTDLAG